MVFNSAVDRVKRRRWWSAAALVASSSLVLAACGSESSDDAEPIKVGILAPTTGSVAADGEDMVRASELVVGRVNKNGGIDGRKIELVVADDACEAQAGTQAAQKLVADEVVAVVGGFCSSASLPASEIFDRNDHLPFVISVSSNPQLTEAGFPGVTRYIGRDDQEAPVAVDYVSNLLGATKVAIMNDNTEFSRSVSKTMKSAFGEQDSVEIVYDDAIQPGQNDYRAALSRVARSGADTLVYTGFYPEFAVLAAQWKSQDLDFRLVGGSSSIDASVIEGAESAAADERFSIVTYPTAALLTNDLASEFLAEYQEAYDAEPGSYGVFQADAMEGLVKALEENPDDLSPEALGKRLRAVEFEGVTGQISFDDAGDREAFPFKAVRAVDGAFSVVASFEPDGGWASAN